MDTQTVRIHIERLKALQGLKSNLIEVQSKIDCNNTLRRATIEQITQSETKYSAMLKEAGVCPVCKQDTKNCQVHS